MPERLNDEQMLMLAGEMTPKFLATRSADGRPNVVPILSVQAADPKTIIFGEFLIWKTRDNLAADPCLAGLVMTQQLKFFRFRAKVRDFVKTGPYFDQVSGGAMFRYNPYTGVRGVWVADLVEAEPIASISPLSVAAGYLGNRLSGAPRLVREKGDRRVLPPPVADKINRMQALKVVAARGGAYPAIFPDFSLWTPDRAGLKGGSGVFRRYYEEASLGFGAEVAVAVLTAQPVAYQVKGVIATSGPGRLGIRITEAFTATPPVPGERVDRPA